VFVETDAKKNYYTMRRVELTNRFDTTVFVRSELPKKAKRPSAEDKEPDMMPSTPLEAGKRLLQSGVGELKAAYLDLLEKDSETKDGRQLNGSKTERSAPPAQS
jgi:cobalt-zinc-cadmium efflux system membrane fusion protein